MPSYGCDTIYFMIDSSVGEKKFFKVCELPLPVEKNRIAALEWLFVIS